MEELGDLVSHKHWENQEKQTHAEATEVFPQTPGSTYEGEINEIGNKLKKEKKHCCCSYLFRDAPSARITGSVISIIDCRVEVTTMKRMMLRRKVRCSACISNRPV